MPDDITTNINSQLFVDGNALFSGDLQIDGQVFNSEISIMKQKIENLEETISFLLNDELIKKRVEFLKSNKSKYKLINL